MITASQESRFASAGPSDSRLNGLSRFGQSGIDLPMISLGLWQNFGDATPIAAQRAIIRR